MITHWNCEICSKRRPDAQISVISYSLKGLMGATRNLKYCNDNPKCERLARQTAKTGKM